MSDHDNDVFNNQVATPPVVDDKAAAKEIADIWVEKLTSIVRPDGTPKYTSVEDALDALRASQEHIARIETENASLAEKAKETETLRETLERLKGNNMNEEKPKQETPASGGQSDDAAIDERVRRALEAREQQTNAVNNVKKVQDALVARFGSKEKAQEAVVAKANELGVSTEKLKLDSAQSPALVLALFGGANASHTPNTNSFNFRGVKVEDTEIKRPEQSLLSGPGATDRNRADLMRKIREKVYKDNGITG